ncbi:alpha/beta hydrolase [Flavihumibacter solisilvae]|uniref:Dienelactone hydrolase domain-containing protein n=1 Tax=Flavihumibacter solisilvae TaxID=1349421 RepID=A0A0C1IHM1_9BACT|nr:alpha/beta hydrolase [Flavihumibacter solisilvae]KIC93710.1 hypothetical protein OI18_16300 [Flavihumibacter solisilvae]
MRLKSIVAAVLFIFNITSATAQHQIIQLYNGPAPKSEKWTWNEKEFSDHNTKLLYDVSHPSVEVFFPPDSIRNGTSVIICPGGGFCLLEVENEGRNIARWLNTKGITAFVLKYRVMKTQTGNPQEEMFAKAMDTKKLAVDADTVIQMAMQDIFTTISKIKNDSTRLKINPGKVGVIGFSAGGTLATALAYNYDKKTKPAFVAVLYPWTAPIKKQIVQSDAPPLFIAAASDDQLGFYIGSAELYLNWVKNKRSAELHLYSTGGHGFAAFKSGNPADSWDNRFVDWLLTNKFIGQ